MDMAEGVDLAAIVRAWRSAFAAAEGALRAAGRDGDLESGELGLESRRLASERVKTVHVLGLLARERQSGRSAISDLVELVEHELAA